MCVMAGLAAYNLVSVEYDYMAESISVGAFMRIQSGLPYLSALTETPLDLNPYSPVYYLLHAPLLSVLPHSLHAAVFLGRSTTLLAGAMALGTTYSLGKEIYGSAFRALPFCICASFMLMAYPDLWNAVRPDLLAVYLELAGLLLFAKSLNSTMAWCRVASAVLCGLALALKLNQLGGVALIVAIQLLTRDWKNTLLFGMTSALSASIAFLIGYAWAGPMAVANMATVIHNNVLSPVEFGLMLTKIAQDMLLGLIPLFCAAAYGAARSSALETPKKLILLLGVPLFFSLASLQQLKAGASVNYYHDFCMLLVIPATWGLAEVMVYLEHTPSQRKIAWVLACSVATICGAAFARRTLFQAVFMRSKNYPFAEARRFLLMKHPGKKIYSEDSNALVHLREFAWLGAGDESMLSFTPKLASTMARLRNELQPSAGQSKTTQAGAVDAVIATGTNCADWKPAGLFAPELSGMTELEARFVRICIFGRHKPAKPVSH